MANILLIETATSVCSVAVARDGRVISTAETSEADRHASLITVFIQHCLDDLGMKANQLHAVAVSAGPGSYTGLRVGVSAAKGLCYALGIPLIAVDTLKALASECRKKSSAGSDDLLVPMIDARRQEVWTAVYEAGQLNVLGKAAPLVLENNMFDYFCSEVRGDNKHRRILLCGNGAFKTSNGSLPENVVLAEPFQCSASYMANLAEADFQNADFQEVSYYEPFYMKPPNITSAKKTL
jgi:tRNA threonylcarbamoyladenosine biosynthesis protein TsaB